MRENLISITALFLSCLINLVCNSPFDSTSAQDFVVLSIVSNSFLKGTTVSESTLKKIAEDCDFFYAEVDGSSKVVFRPIQNMSEYLSRGEYKEIVFFHKNKESNSKGVSLYLNGNNVIESVGEFKY